MYIRTILRTAIHRKRQEMTDRSEVLDPPYFPVFDLFPKLKEPLRGIRYESLDELECAVNREVRRINFGSLANGIQALPKRWISVIQSRVDYFEGF